ncbi:ABC transporter ATP-binding protein [Streptomyces sp. NPDC005009]
MKPSRVSLRPSTGLTVVPRRLKTAWAAAVAASPGRLAAVGALSLFSGLLTPVMAWLTKTILDRLVAGSSPEGFVPAAVGMAIAGLLSALIPHWTKYLLAEMRRAVGLVTQERLFTSVGHNAGLRRFEDPIFLDRLRLAQQAGRATPNEVVEGMLSMARSLVVVTGFIGSLLVLNPVMALLVLMAGLPALAAQISLARSRARMSWKVGPDERREIFYGHLLSNVAAAKETRLFGTGDYLKDRMLAARRAVNRAGRALDHREMRIQSSLCTLTALVSGSGLLWAVRAAHHGALSMGDITVFVAAVAGVQGAMAAMATDTARVHHALIMIDHYTTVTTADPDLPSAAEPAVLVPLRHCIELRDVWFRYSEDHHWVLRGVSMRIPFGTSMALVGPNGAGKSTIVKLLCRFYDPTHGSVLWDGTDLRDIDPADLRRRIGAVFQDYMNYDMTAAENIGLGDLDALLEDAACYGPPGDCPARGRIRTAAQLAGVHKALANLPHGYDTMLSRMFFTESDKEDSSTGVVLSGGQWQRLALARAFLRGQRDLMILDEPSAGLDAEAEHEIHTSIRAHRQGRTSLLISHRLGAVREADLIVVLKRGRIEESGGHASLMAAGGTYARLFTLQAAGYRQEGQAGSNALVGPS